MWPMQLYISQKILYLNKCIQYTLNRYKICMVLDWKRVTLSDEKNFVVIKEKCEKCAWQSWRASYIPKWKVPTLSMEQ